jgi:hypothetical protein
MRSRLAPHSGSAYSQEIVQPCFAANLRNCASWFSTSWPLGAHRRVLSMGRGSLVPVTALSKQRARKQGQATPNSEFPPELFSFEQFEDERVSHRFACGLRPRNGPFAAALKLLCQLLVFWRRLQIPFRPVGWTSTDFLLCV